MTSIGQELRPKVRILLKLRIEACQFSGDSAFVGNQSETGAGRWRECDQPARTPCSPLPKGASQTAVGAVPVKDVVFSLPRVKNPMERLSGDQNGWRAPSVPVRGRAWVELQRAYPQLRCAFRIGNKGQI